MEKFFADLIQKMKDDPDQAFRLMLTAEEEFKRAGYREPAPVGVENILIVRLDAIGDMILTSGFIREVRANFPQARITLLCSPITYPVVEFCPYVNEVLTIDKGKINNEFHNIFEHVVAFCKENLWSKHFSLALSPQWGTSNLFSLLVAWLSGARERVGYGSSPYASWGIEPPAKTAAIDNFLLTKNIVAPREVVSEVEKYFYLLAAIGLEINKDNMELFFGTADFIRAQELLKDIPSNLKKVLLGIGSGLINRQYPVDKLLIALKELAEKDLCFVIVGGQKELEDARRIEENLPQEKVLNLAGKTTLRETEAIISQMDYYIGNDSGVMHMAAAVQIPCLVFYRDAQDKEDYLPGLYSEFRRFPPWQTESVILRPDHQLEECAKLEPIYGWCHKEEAHCITQIPPQQIVEGFAALEELN